MEALLATVRLLDTTDVPAHTYYLLRCHAKSANLHVLDTSHIHSVEGNSVQIYRFNVTIEKASTRIKREAQERSEIS